MSRENALKVLDSIEYWEDKVSSDENQEAEMVSNEEKYKTGFHFLFQSGGMNYYAIWVEFNRQGYRVIGEESEENLITWFWAGTHEQYVTKIKNMKNA